MAGGAPESTRPNDATPTVVTTTAAPHSSAPPGRVFSPPAAELTLSSGEFARELIQRHTRRLGLLQAEVLADRDPEALHQLRVNLRRLRTVLLLFAPALELPQRVSKRRIAALARRTGRCRDLDVLRQRVLERWLPRLPEGEQRLLARARRQLKRDRAEAFASLREALLDSGHRKLLARLHRWQKRPDFTPLGQLPLLSWLADWQAPFTAGLFLHRGWWVNDPEAEVLHDLRKRIKRARYGLEPFERWCQPALLDWIEDLKQAQEHLGELHDLQVLQRGVVVAESLRCIVQLPVLRAELAAQREVHWLRWRALAERLCQDRDRRATQRLLLDLPGSVPT